MATITLTADTDYSALTVANDDTIDCAGFILTLDEQPSQTGIQVTSPGTNGRVVFSGAWVLPTWDFYAGANGIGGMIGTLPEGASIKSITGGSAGNGVGISVNNGTVTTSNGGSASNANGIHTNSATGIVTTANGGSVGAATGVSTNNGIVTTANGGVDVSSVGVGTNNGIVTTANGILGLAMNTNNGTVAVCNPKGMQANNGEVMICTGGSLINVFGITNNNGTVMLAVGGTHALGAGIGNNHGLCLRLTDNTGKGVGNWRGTTCFVEGPHIAGIIPNNIKTIYSLGTLSASATIAADADVIEVSKGKGLTGIR